MNNKRQLDKTILREYDIRGIVNQNFSTADVRSIGHGFGTIVALRGGKSVAVGYDGRLTSPELEEAVVEGLCSAGMHVYRIGLGPSPMLYYATNLLETDAGLMVTGSHNPPSYNGIKMSIFGSSFFGNDIKELLKIEQIEDKNTNNSSSLIDNILKKID